MGRNKKPIELKKLEGTYRADRDGAQEVAQSTLSAVSGVLVPADEHIQCPKTVQDKYCRKYWKVLTSTLISLQLLAYTDIPLLENMILILQQLRAAQSALTDISVTDIEMQDRYFMLSKLTRDLNNSFNTIAVKFYISPAARNKLTLEALTGAKLAQEIQKNASPVDAILRMREGRK